MSVGKEEILLQEQARWNGWIPWREFMRLALYHEDFGYYSNSIKAIGDRGDFITVPARYKNLASATRKWSESIRRKFPALASAPFIEIGAGSGDFAKQFLDASGILSRWYKPYWIVEVSAPLQKIQRRTLRRRNVRWFSSPQEAVTAARGHAILFSNELVDAFPCTLLEMTATGWMEVGIQMEGDNVREVLSPLPSIDSTVFKFQGFALGQRVEVHDTWRSWLEEWIGALKQAVLLTIDYGGYAKDIYKRRPKGTLRGYFQHQRLEGKQIYSRLGKMDLTADVNLDDLLHWGEAQGLDETNVDSLSGFLQKYDPSTAKGEVPSRLENPYDAWGAFFVLEQTFPAAPRIFSTNLGV